MERRTLRFHDFAQALQDADALLASGYTRAGNWGLAEVADHLCRVIGLSLDGFPIRYPWPMRIVARWFALPRILRHRVFRMRMTSPQCLMPTAAEDDRTAVERLRAVIDRFGRHTRELQPHPVFGTLSRDEWREVHLWHCEHHFSFLHPRSAAGGEPLSQ